MNKLFPKRIRSLMYVKRLYKMMQTFVQCNTFIYLSGYVLSLFCEKQEEQKKATTKHKIK